MPLAGHGLRPTALRRRARRPQLKRDPLGGSGVAMTMFLNKPSLRAIAHAWAERARTILATVGASSLPAQQVISAFREAGAITPEAAQRFHAGSRMEEDAFWHLMRLEIIREPTHGRYYLDERSLETVRRQGLAPWL